MGQKEFLIAITDFFKILTNTLIVVMFGIAAYNLQTKGSIFAESIIGIGSIGVVTFIIVIIYAYFLKDLKNLKL